MTFTPPRRWGEFAGQALRQRPFLAWTAVLGLGILAWLLLGEPLIDGLDSLERETLALRQALPARAAALARERARLEATQVQAREARRQADQLGPADQTGLEQQVARLARDQGLTISALAPLPPAEREAHRLLSVSLQAQGDYKSVAGFFQALSQAPGMLHPLSINLARAPGSTALNLEMQVAGLARN